MTNSKELCDALLPFVRQHCADFRRSEDKVDRMEDRLANIEKLLKQAYRSTRLEFDCVTYMPVHATSSPRDAGMDSSRLVNPTALFVSSSDVTANTHLTPASDENKQTACGGAYDSLDLANGKR